MSDLFQFSTPQVSPVVAPQENGYLSQFLQSALRSGTSEMVGLPGAWTGPVAPNDEWRNQNPIASVASQIMGAAPAYIGSAIVAPPLAGAAGVARIAPWLPRLFSAEALLARPIATTAGRAVVETVPVTAGRLMLSPLLGGDIEQTAASAGMDLAGAALLGAGFGAFRAMRTGAPIDDVERRLADSITGYNRTDPIQDRLTVLREAPAPTDPQLRTLIEDTIAGLSAQVRTENVRMRHLGPLEGFDEGITRSSVNRLFNSPSGATPGYASRRFIVNPRRGFASADEWQGALSSVGLPDGWETNIQYPRWITANNETEATRIGSNLRHTLSDAGQGWLIRREANQDIFTIAKHIPERNAWFLARTNAPERIIPGAPALRRAERLSRFVGSTENDALAAAARQQPDSIIARDIERDAAMPVRARVEKAKFDAMEFFPEPLRGAAKEFKPLASAVWTKLKGVGAPAMAQFRNAPLAQWVQSRARIVFQDAQGRARQLLHGTLTSEESIGRQVAKGMRGSGGLRQSFEKLNWEEDVGALQRAWFERLHGADREAAIDAAVGPLESPVQRQRIRDFLTELGKVQDTAFGELQHTQRTVGGKVTGAEENYDIPHIWAGEFRQRVLDDNGKLVWVGSGNTSGEARKAAQAFADRNGYRLDPAGVRTANEYTQDLQAMNELVRTRRNMPRPMSPTSPDSLTKRQKQGIGGYLGDVDVAPPSARDFWKIIENDIQEKYTHIASLAVNRRYAQEMLPEVVKRYGSEVGAQLTRRMNDMLGRQTEFSKWQNKALAPLNPLIGSNSATKIATTLNATETHLQLGFYNFGYIATQAVSFLQTVAPKIALMRQMIARGESDRAMALYDFFPHIGQGGVEGAVAALSPMKVMKAGFDDLLRPSAEQMGFFRRAAGEGILAPKMYDDYLGETSRVSTSLRAMMKGEEPISNGMRALSGTSLAIPIKIEELSRAHTFMTALRMGEVVGLQGEARYQFAKQFTYQTMYGFAQADRPRMFTGPAGMVFGLFKNWMFHYMSDFTMYGREALKGNYQGLLWATAGTAAIGGLGALPLYSAVDSFQKLFTNVPIMEELYGATGTQAGDALFYGVPGILGLSLQASASAPFNDPVRDITFLGNVAALDRARRVGGLLGESWNMWSRGGINPLESDRTWDLASYALGPRTLYKAMAQIEDGSLRSIRNGRPIIDGVTSLEQGLNTVGLTPVRIARAWEASESLWSDQTSRRARTTQYAEAFHQAQQMGDSRAMTDVVQRAVAHGADLSSVMQGAMQRQRDLLLPQMPFDYLRMPGGAGIQRLQSLGLIQ